MVATGTGLDDGQPGGGVRDPYVQQTIGGTGIGEELVAVLGHVPDHLA